MKQDIGSPSRTWTNGTKVMVNLSGMSKRERNASLAALRHKLGEDVQVFLDRKRKIIICRPAARDMIEAIQNRTDKIVVTKLEQLRRPRDWRQHGHSRKLNNHQIPIWQH